MGYGESEAYRAGLYMTDFGYSYYPPDDEEEDDMAVEAGKQGEMQNDYPVFTPFVGELFVGCPVPEGQAVSFVVYCWDKMFGWSNSGSARTLDGAKEIIREERKRLPSNSGYKVYAHLKSDGWSDSSGPVVYEEAWDETGPAGRSVRRCLRSPPCNSK